MGELDQALHRLSGMGFRTDPLSGGGSVRHHVGAMLQPAVPIRLNGEGCGFEQQCATKKMERLAPVRER